MFNIENIFPFVLLVISILILLGNVLYLNIKINKLLAGGLAESLPQTIELLRRQVESQNDFKKEMVEYLKIAEQRILRSTQGISVVRFNPFKDSGNGGQSFAAAFIDEAGNGLIISSLYVRDRVSVYAKELKSFESTFELTAEEKLAISQARKTLSLPKK